MERKIARPERSSVVPCPQQHFVPPDLHCPGACSTYSNLGAIIDIGSVSQGLIEQGRVTPGNDPDNCSSCPAFQIKEVMVTRCASCLLHRNARSNQGITIGFEGEVIDCFS